MKDFNFGENLRIVRQAKGISQEVMAIGLGISQSTYSKMERDPKVPDLELVKRMADMLEVEPSVLLSGRDIGDLVPKIGFEQKARDIINTPLGIIFFCILAIPFINAAYSAGDGFCAGLGTTDKVRKIVRFAAGFAAMALAYYWMRRLQRGKG